MRVAVSMVFAIGAMALLLVGADPVGSVTSQAPFQLRNARVDPTVGVASFPVVAGDTLVAGSSPVVISLPGQSTFTLNPFATALIVRSGGELAVQAAAGAGTRAAGDEEQPLADASDRRGNCGKGKGQGPPNTKSCP